MVAALVATLLAVTPPHGAKLDGHWTLGHGYEARRYRRIRIPLSEAATVERSRWFEAGA